jgi:hypothetical protein
MNDLEQYVRVTLERAAGQPATRFMPPGTVRRVRLRTATFVSGVALLVAVSLVAGLVLFDVLPRGSEGDRPARGNDSPRREVPPGWPQVQLEDPGSAFLPSMSDPGLTDGPVALVAGSVDGSAFTLFGYTLGAGADGTPCLGFVGFAPPGSPLEDHFVGTCADEPAVPGDRDVAFIVAASPGRSDLEAVFGFASRRTDEVWVGAGGDLGSFPIELLPPLPVWDVTPFFFVPPADAGPLEALAVVGSDRQVMPLAHADLCTPAAAGGGTCRPDVLQDLPLSSPVDVPVPLARGAWPVITFGGEFEPYVDHEADARGVVDPGVVGTKAVIAYGTVQGAPWSLVAYNVRLSGAPGGLDPSSQLFVVGLGGGGPALYETRPWSPNDLSASRGGADGVGFESVQGVVSLRVAAVRMELDDGTIREQRLIPGPDGVGAQYFVDFIPSGLTGRLVALDSDGTELEQMCLRDMAGLPPGGDPCQVA